MAKLPLIVLLEDHIDPAGLLAHRKLIEELVNHHHYRIIAVENAAEQVNYKDNSLILFVERLKATLEATLSHQDSTFTLYENLLNKIQKKFPDKNLNFLTQEILKQEMQAEGIFLTEEQYNETFYLIFIIEWYKITIKTLEFLTINQCSIHYVDEVKLTNFSKGISIYVSKEGKEFIETSITEREKSMAKSTFDLYQENEKGVILMGIGVSHFKGLAELFNDYNILDNCIFFYPSCKSNAKMAWPTNINVLSYEMDLNTMTNNSQIQEAEEILMHYKKLSMDLFDKVSASSKKNDSYLSLDNQALPSGLTWLWNRCYQTISDYFFPPLTKPKTK